MISDGNKTRHASSIDNSTKTIYHLYRHLKQPPEVFCKKGVLRNFAKFTRKKPVPESLF